MPDEPAPADDRRKGLEKPLYGNPCNGCGACCMSVPCPISQAIFNKPSCPALEWTGNAYTCGLFTNLSAYVPGMTAWGGSALSQAFALLLGAGLGCDGVLTEADEIARPLADEVMKAKALAAISSAPDDVRELVAYFRDITHA